MGYQRTNQVRTPMETIRLFTPDESRDNNAPTVSDVLDWYEANQLKSFSPDAIKERRRQWDLFRQVNGDKPAEACRPVDLIEFIAGQKGAKAAWTRRRIKSTICTPFNTAATVGLLQRNPFAGVKLPKGNDGRDWTKEEYQTILRESPPYFRRLVVFLRFAGARPGEGRTLTWLEIKDEVEAIVQANHKTAHISPAPRRIHFNHVLLRLLIWLRRHKQHDINVFVNKCGRPWTIRALTNHLALLRKKVCLPADVKMHGLRHTFATQALLNGVDIFTLAELLGHKSVKTTERYVHLVNKRSHLNAAMNKAIGRGSKKD